MWQTESTISIFYIQINGLNLREETVCSGCVHEKRTQIFCSDSLALKDDNDSQGWTKYI